MHQPGYGSSLGRTVTGTSGRQWAVASPHAQASAAGAAAFRAGGNAVDAALAAAAMLTVVYPNQCSLGGDLIALVAPANGGAFVVNASGRSPAALSTHSLAGLTAMPVAGALPVTVPGVVSGWAELARRWARLPLADALSDAHAAAAEGVPVAPGLARDLAVEQTLLARDEGARSIFFSDSRVLRAGDQLRQPNLAASLGTLAEQGAEAFYHGPLGESLIALLRDNGSPMTMADFREHRVAVDSGVSLPFGDVEYLTSGDNTQGTFFLEGLNALQEVAAERGPLDQLGSDAGLVARVLAEVAADRDRLLADPEASELPTAWLLSEQRALEIGAKARTAPNKTAGKPALRAGGDTVAVVTVDAEGNWVSLIQSVFHAFGAGLLDPATGILLHNRGASFSLDPRAANYLRPAVRPPHTLMPVLVRRDGAFVGAHGAMGGRAQSQIHTHVALSKAAGATALQAVTAPRWVLGAMEAGAAASTASMIKAETDVPLAAQASLRESGFGVEVLPQRDDAVGHAQVVRWEPAGQFAAASDPRADGAALAG